MPIKITSNITLKGSFRIKLNMSEKKFNSLSDIHTSEIIMDAIDWDNWLDCADIIDWDLIDIEEV